MRTAKPSPIAMYIAGENESVIADALIDQSRRDALARAHQRVLQDMRAVSAERARKRERRSRLRRYCAESCALVVVLGGALAVVCAGWWGLIALVRWAVGIF